jgi:CDGSH-type Zn-finger protein
MELGYDEKTRIITRDSTEALCGCCEQSFLQLFRNTENPRIITRTKDSTEALCRCCEQGFLRLFQNTKNQ